MKIGQRTAFGYTLVEILDLNNLENYKEHRRLKVFYYKGVTCVSCGRKGELLGVGRDSHGGLHVDLYSNDGTPFTIDHIVPRSKGGDRYDLDNLQPMCRACNSKKGAKMP